jgi:RNA polymerase sigma-54 factor
MTLMSLTADELRQKIEGELASNPALEVVEEHRCPTCHRNLSDGGPCPVCSRPQGLSLEEPVVFVSPREDFYTSKSASNSEELPDEEITANVEDLPTFVMRQIAPDLDTDDRLLAAHILTSLDEDGLLRIPLVEIARYHHVSISRVENVLGLIQRAEPVGVGSSSPQEALLVQLKVLSETHPTPPLASMAIQEGMDLLSRHQYGDLGQLLDISLSQAKNIAYFISENLNPYPARAHWGDIRQSAEPIQDVYHLPDIIISFLNNSPEPTLVIEIVAPLAGKLRVNPMFRTALSEAPADKSEQWKDDIERASLLIKCIQQRNHTIVRLMQRLAVIQREFILHGDACLAPITRASLAKALDVHESTISRAVSSKAVQLPSGRIIPMAKLFDRSLHIRTILRQIIDQENKPLTDTQLAKRLKEKGFPVARRTVAKYRSMEGILPAHLRRELRQQVQPPQLSPQPR